MRWNCRCWISCGRPLSAEDGVWIYPEAVGGKNAGLAAWWYGGVLQNLDLVTLSSADQAED